MGKGPEQVSLKKDDVQMTKETWKGAQHPPVLRGTRVRASEVSLHASQTLGCQDKDNASGQKAEGREPRARPLGRQPVQPPRKTAWSFLKQLNTEPPTA